MKGGTPDGWRPDDRRMARRWSSDVGKVGRDGEEELGRVCARWEHFEEKLGV